MKRRTLVLVLAVVLGAVGLASHVGVAGNPVGRNESPSALAGLTTTDANLTVSLSVGPTTTEAGFPVTAYCTVSGGMPPYVVTMDSGIPGGTWTLLNESPPYQPVSIGGGADYPDGGTYIITCTATDAALATTSANATVHIVARPTLVLRASTASLSEGQNVTLTASVQGGTAPFTFLWMNLPPGCPYGNVSSIDCTPTAPGTWTVTATILDSYGVYRVSSYTLSVTESALVLGMPQAEATVFLGIVALVAVVLLALGGLLLIRRRRGNQHPASSVPEPQSIETEGAETAQAREPPGPDGLLATRWRALAPPVRGAFLLAALAGLSAGFYSGATWLDSYIPELAPPGLSPLLFLLALLVAVVSVKLMGPLLSIAGLLGGIALYYAVSQPMAACTDSTTLAQTLGVPTCGGLSTTAVEAGIVVGVIAAGAGAFLLRWSRTPRSEKPFLAAGVVVVAALLAASTVVLTHPPPVPPGAGPEVLPFPIPAGSAFLVPFEYYDPATNYTFYTSGPQAFVRVSANGFEPAVLVGGWNSSVAVCLYVGNANHGPILPPPGRAYGDCGTSVAFHYLLEPAAWTVSFWLQNFTDESATITITQTVQLVY